MVYHWNILGLQETDMRSAKHWGMLEVCNPELWQVWPAVANHSPGTYSCSHRLWSHSVDNPVELGGGQDDSIRATFQPQSAQPMGLITLVALTICSADS